MEAVERRLVLPGPVERVWSSLTEGPRLSTWFGAEIEVDLRSGGRATFRWADGRERAAVVEEAEPLRRFAFRWLPFERGPDGEARLVPVTRVAFELGETDEGVVLTVTETELRRAGAGPRLLEPERSLQ